MYFDVIQNDITNMKVYAIVLLANENLKEEEPLKQYLKKPDEKN